ncbi:hypothetical protein B0T26DRAFT_734146 [Lasiosphaeria miniovina]|uniref:Chromatin remodeling complex subunit n=1 Tax=Lasiosphaeria miniovina TaxID=1954250 RepID=A0AA39ZQ93_9PEZI|nr:uncharacterized protein B0T26DRAFT_734146 [Lasiosphaeria miniovina]KAK0701652.1 hypothetical protein B0T26DRAFT_734146 [Lasiosphaeria miniovina]
MSGQTSKWREEQILVICPGSQTTMAQLGCGELTPPVHRFPTRMFKDDESDDWRPYRTYKRKKAVSTPSVSNGASNATTTATAGATANGAAAKDEDEWEYVEDTDSVEGAVYPIRAGRIANMDAFLAFLDHVHGILTTTYHNTPIMLMASPQWTRPDCEAIARYIFEKTRTPALCLINSGIATQYGLKWPNMTVVDVGFEKVDVTCIYESQVVSHLDVGSYPGPERDVSGGEVFTRKLASLLKAKGFDYEMAEQLKKNPICEVLPYAPDTPELMELPADTGDGSKIVAPIADIDDGLNIDGKDVEDEGVLDVANIVVSGQTREFLAKKEKEKAERAKAGRKAKEREGNEAAAARTARLPNSKRPWNVFHYEELVTEEVPVAAPVPAPAPAPAPASIPAIAPTPAGIENSTTDVTMGDASGATTGTAPEAATATTAPIEGSAIDVAKPEPSADQQQASVGSEAVKPEEAKAEAPPAPAAPETAQLTEKQTKRVRRDIEIGIERFLFAERAEIDRIVTAIYRAVQGIENMYMRPYCWENIVFVGNGTRIRGLKDNIMQTLQARHLVSPSSATMFTSELPSNLGTPSGTGSQTPTGSFTGAPHQLPTTSSVNPLLQAATTASLGIPGGPAAVAAAAAAAANANAPGSNAGDASSAPSHHFHSQTPTTIKLAQLPTYLSEWTKNGFEEAMFLGAQVAARLAFCIHNLDVQGLESQRLMSLTRIDYNEHGPKAIRSHSMLG